MSTRINTNTTAFMATQNLDMNSGKLSNDIEQLSTGLRINTAADDAAGYVISQNMTSQIGGLSQATANTNDAINMVKTANGALTQVQSLLQSMRQLAVQASNLGANSSTEVAADQSQIASALQSINRIASTTQFGTKYLLNGSANANATVTGGSAAITGTGATLLSQGTWTTGQTYAYNQSTIAAATATVAAGTLGANYVAATTTFGGNINVNGTQYNITAGTSLTQVNTAIAGSGYALGATGGTAALTLTSSTTGQPQTTQTVNLSGLTNSAGGATTNGALTAGTNSSLTLKDGTPAHNLTSSSSVSNGDGTTTYLFSNGTAIQLIPADVAGMTLNTTAGSSTTGQALEFQLGANAGQTSSINIQATSTDNLGNNTASYTDANGNSQTVYASSLSNINVSTFKGAQDAIAVIDKAVNDVSTIQANLGSLQTNVLQSNATSLSVAQQNLSSSKSSITDADLAATIVNYTKDQILVQSATSALSYANQMPQSVLKLLQ